MASAMPSRLLQLQGGAGGQAARATAWGCGRPPRDDRAPPQSILCPPGGSSGPRTSQGPACPASATTSMWSGAGPGRAASRAYRGRRAAAHCVSRARCMHQWLIGLNTRQDACSRPLVQAGREAVGGPGMAPMPRLAAPQPHRSSCSGCLTRVCAATGAIRAFNSELTERREPRRTALQASLTYGTSSGGRAIVGRSRPPAGRQPGAPRDRSKTPRRAWRPSVGAPTALEACMFPRPKRRRLGNPHSTRWRVPWRVAWLA